MKILCDVCGEEEATVLCCADEAALCRGCDARVHSANKLAGKHRRLSLLRPSSSLKTLPLCDICKEKKAFVFCQQDRAILCRDCDLPMHTANTHAGKHCRFLLTGISISAARISSATSSPPASETDMVSSSNITASSRVRCSTAEEDAVCTAAAAKGNSSGDGGSTISDYLMNMLPGWRVDDFLFDDAAIASTPRANGTGYCPEEAGTEAPFEVTGGVSSRSWAWPCGAATDKMVEDVPIWLPPVPAPAADMAPERLNPVLEAMEGGRSELKEEEISMLPLFEYRHRSKKRCRISLWC